MADESPKLQTRIRSVMEDPSAQAVARVYADAFLGAAQSAGIDEGLEEFDSFLTDVLVPHPDFERLLLSGIVSRDEKIGLIDRVVAPHGSELFTSFLRVLARHDRLDLLPLVCRESRTMHERRTGRMRVRVTSAAPLSDGAKEKIRQRLSETFHFEPILETDEDASLLGGVVIQVGDTIYDSSLRTRVRQLTDRMRQRYLNEIQSGRDRFSSAEGN